MNCGYEFVGSNVEKQETKAAMHQNKVLTFISEDGCFAYSKTKDKVFIQQKQAFLICKHLTFKSEKLNHPLKIILIKIK